MRLWILRDAYWWWQRFDYDGHTAESMHYRYGIEVDVSEQWAKAAA